MGHHFDQGTPEYAMLGYSPDDFRHLITDTELAAVTERLGRRPRTHITPGGTWLLIGPDDTDVHAAYRQETRP